VASTIWQALLGGDDGAGADGGDSGLTPTGQRRAQGVAGPRGSIRKGAMGPILAMLRNDGAFGGR